jgi:hypothetical protein
MVTDHRLTHPARNGKRPAPPIIEQETAAQESNWLYLYLMRCGAAERHERYCPRCRGVALPEAHESYCDEAMRLAQLADDAWESAHPAEPGRSGPSLIPLSLF